MWLKLLHIPGCAQALANPVATLQIVPSPGALELYAMSFCLHKIISIVTVECTCKPQMH